MSREQTTSAIRNEARAVAAGHDGLLQIWGRRVFLQIRIRWAVGPIMVAAALTGRALGFEFRLGPVLLIAAIVLAYNLAFLLLARSFGERIDREPALSRRLTLAGICTDYVSMLFLLFLTGGASSPLIVLLFLHVIVAAIQFRPKVALWIAVAAASGPWLLLLDQWIDWLPGVRISFRGQPAHAMDRPYYLTLMLLVFTATLFVTVFLITRIMDRFRERVGELARVTTELGAAHDKLRSLYAMVCAIGAERHLEPILQRVVSELARVLDVPVVGVQLLSEDGKTLRYVAAHGLSDESAAGTNVRLDQSSLARKVLAGETVVLGRSPGDGLEDRKELAELGIRSGLLTPLKFEDRTIGTLGLFARSPDRFDGEQEFLELAAGLVAIAIEDARANEAIENLVDERTQFMLQVSHNLRAPLGASLSMLDLVLEGHMGELSPEQVETLRTIDKRLRALNQAAGEILTIARTRDWNREIPDVVVNLQQLAEQTRQTFRDDAAQKKIRFTVNTDDHLPAAIDSGANLLEQLMENLVSNAIKYTPDGGSVEVSFTHARDGEVRIMVQDSGIGIPADEQEKLFTEFFRASNAKKIETAGTGLGLALVQKTVERHKGRIRLASEVGQGTTVVIDLPIRQDRRPAAE